MDWRIKGVLQKALSHIPLGVAANDLLRHAVGGRRRLDREIAVKVEADWLVMMEHLKVLGIRPQGLDYLEIGTGWYPTLPFCFALAGAGTCQTFDRSRHLNERMSCRLVLALERFLPDIATASGSPLPDVESAYRNLAQGAGLAETLARARVEYHAPADAATTGLPPCSIDVVYSNSVLEHVPREAIARIMAESRRVLRPGGIVMHSVNCGDHYAYFDRSITQINYLSYPERAWRLWNNDIQYQNRLRAQDFLVLAREAGLEIILSEHHAKTHLLQQLATMDIAPEFRAYPPEQLACTSIDFVARRPK